MYASCKIKFGKNCELINELRDSASVSELDKYVKLLTKFLDSDL